MTRSASFALTFALACSLSSVAAAEGGPDAPPDPAAGTAPPASQPVMQPVGATSAPTTAPTMAPSAAPIEIEAEHPAPNSIFVEGLGAGLFYSINYERLVLDQLGLRIGLSYVQYGAAATSPTSTTSSNVSYFTVPLTAEYLGLRAGSHVVVIGAGGTLVFQDADASGGGLTATSSGVNALGTAHLGYRIHPIDGGFQFRVGAALIYGPGISLSSPSPERWGVIPWFYISAGASF